MRKNIKKIQSGFTMVELVITLLLMLVMLSLTAPAISSFIDKGNIANVVSSVYSSLQAARGEAVSRNGLVTICGGTVATGCGSNWTGHIIIFEDDNANGQKDFADTLLKDINVNKGQVFTAFSGVITFDGGGFLRTSPVTLVFCDNTNNVRSIDVLRTGTPVLNSYNASNQTITVTGALAVC